MAMLDTVTPDRLLRDIELVTPGVLRAVLENELHTTIRDFCRRTLALKDELSVTLPADTAQITLPTVNGMKPIYVWSGRTADGADLYADPKLRHRSYTVVNVSPRKYYCPDENVMVFEGGPQADLGLTLVCAFCPVSDTTKVPAPLYERQYEALKAGVLGRLYMQVAKPYTNLALGRLNMASYSAGVTKAKYEAAQELTRADAPWQYPRWA